HPNVNVATKDPDVQQGLLALSSRQHAKHGGFIRALQQRFQAPVFWLVGAPLVLVDLRVTSLYWDLTHMRGSNANRIDLAFLAAHYALWVGLPALFLPFATVAVVYGFMTLLCGFFLTAIFAPAH